jgi:hypothetical protein
VVRVGVVVLQEKVMRVDNVTLADHDVVAAEKNGSVLSSIKR